MLYNINIKDIDNKKKEKKSQIKKKKKKKYLSKCIKRSSKLRDQRTKLIKDLIGGLAALNITWHSFLVAVLFKNNFFVNTVSSCSILSTE